MVFVCFTFMSSVSALYHDEAGSLIVLEVLFVSH